MGFVAKQNSDFWVFWDTLFFTQVLHHLPGPLHGLQTLSNTLSPDGGMNLMVYPRVARTGVLYSPVLQKLSSLLLLSGIYHFQQLVQLINEGVRERTEELDNLWALLRLPYFSYLDVDHNQFGQLTFALRDFVASPQLGLTSLQVTISCDHNVPVFSEGWSSDMATTLIMKRTTFSTCKLF